MRSSCALHQATQNGAKLGGTSFLMVRTSQQYMLSWILVVGKASHSWSATSVSSAEVAQTSFHNFTMDVELAVDILPVKPAVSLFDGKVLYLQGTPGVFFFFPTRSGLQVVSSQLDMSV